MILLAPQDRRELLHTHTRISSRHALPNAGLPTSRATATAIPPLWHSTAGECRSRGKRCQISIASRAAKALGIQSGCNHTLHAGRVPAKRVFELASEHAEAARRSFAGSTRCARRDSGLRWRVRQKRDFQQSQFPETRPSLAPISCLSERAGRGAASRAYGPIAMPATVVPRPSSGLNGKRTAWKAYPMRAQKAGGTYTISPSISTMFVRWSPAWMASRLT